MNRIAGIVLSGLVVVLAGCTTAEYRADFDPDVEFGKYATYEWVPLDEMPARDPMAQNDRADRLIRAAIEDELGVKGLEMAADAPDLRIAYVTGITDRLGETSWGTGYGGKYWENPSSARREGTLILDLIDADSADLVWRGVVSGVIVSNQGAGQLREIVTKLLAQYPPAK